VNPAQISECHPSEKLLVPICVVDDYESLLRLSILLLQEAGFSAVGTRDPEIAFRGIHKGSYRVLLVDVRMPDTDGFAFLDRALQVDPALRIILVTGFYSDQEATTAIEHGACGYLPKPLDWRHLFSILDGFALIEARRLKG
jgi:DNA-binding NtrC family response regulator